MTKNLKDKIFLLFPFLFAVITLISVFTRTPFWDETHAFEIARLNLKEIFYLTRIEGHPLIWYLVLKPFSSIKLYPYSMLIINWIFCTGAVFILWKKSPFNILIKILITFSTPFLFYFGVVARDYAIGIFFLFLICSLFNKRFKKPCIFSTLLLICSNTSLMTYIICFWLWLMYLFQLFKKKSNDFKIALGVFILNGLLFLAQFFELQLPYYIKENHQDFAKELAGFIIVPHARNFSGFIFHIAVFILFYFLLIYLFKKSKYALYLFLSSFITLTYVFYFVCSASWWNRLFYYVYLIVVLWLFKKQIFSNKILKYLITVVLFFCITPKILLGYPDYPYINSSKSKQIVEDVLGEIYPKDTKLYCLDWWSDVSPASDIYFLQKGIDIYDVFGYKRTSFESIKNIFFYRTMALDLEKFEQSLDKTKRNLIITDGTMFDMAKTPNSKKYRFKSIAADVNKKSGIFELIKK